MQTVTLHLDDRLQNPGDTYSWSDTLDEHAYTVGTHQFELPHGITYDVVLTHAGDGILVTGVLNAEVKGTCDRCLEAADFTVLGEVDEYFLFHAPDTHATPTKGRKTASAKASAKAGKNSHADALWDEDIHDSEDDDTFDYQLVGSNNTLDLTDALTTALVSETPFVVLCREDCRGLCPTCGHNLNEGDCEHVAQAAEKREQERLESNPFYVLKDLKL